MRVAIVIFDQFSMTSFGKIHKILRKIQAMYVKICAYKEETCDDLGIFVLPQIYAQSLYGYDAVIFVDGNIQNLACDEIYLSWVKSACDASHKICFGNSRAIFEAAKFGEFMHFDEVDELKLTEIFTS